MREASVDPALGSGFAGWGASIRRSHELRQAGARAHGRGDPGNEPLQTMRNRCACSLRWRAGEPCSATATPAGYSAPRAAVERARPAAADAGNDGRMDIAINTIGGKLVLLSPQGSSGHWLDVQLARFSPGAVVTAELSDGRFSHA